MECQPAARAGCRSQLMVEDPHKSGRRRVVAGEEGATAAVRGGKRAARHTPKSLYPSLSGRRPRDLTQDLAALSALRTCSCLLIHSPRRRSWTWAPRRARACCLCSSPGTNRTLVPGGGREQYQPDCGSSGAAAAATAKLASRKVCTAAARPHLVLSRHRLVVASGLLLVVRVVACGAPTAAWHSGRPWQAPSQARPSLAPTCIVMV
jgi:hypothetical protein